LLQDNENDAMRIPKHHWISWGGGLLFLLSGFWLDDPVRSFFLSHHSAWANTLMEGASHYGRGYTLTLFCALFLVLGLILRKRKWLETGELSLYSLIVSGLLTQIVKYLVGRARPRLIEYGLTFVGPSLSAGVSGYDSFPSGHAASTFALAVVLTRAYPGGSVFFYLTACVISSSRTYLSAHFFSDVVGGALFGVWAGSLLVSYAPRVLSFTERIENQNRGLLAASGALTVAVLLFFYNIGTVPLFDVDESVFAETTREMMESGNLITPIYNYSHRYDKPILIYWFMSSAFALLGKTEFAARFWSALAGCGIVILTFLFARAVATLRTALFSALILATSMEMLVLTHLAITDMVLTFFITASLFGFFLATQETASSRQTMWALAAWSAAAAAVLTKGPIGFLFPVSVISLFLWFSGRIREGKRQLRLGAGTALFCALTLPWFIAASLRTEDNFLRVFLFEHNVMRYLSANSGHGGPWYYYLPVTALGFLPWTAFLPASLRSAWKYKMESRRDSPDKNLPLFLLLWIFVIFFFFSLARTKLPNYVAPLFPALSLLVGWWWDRALSGQEEEKSVRFSAVCAAVLGLILTLSLAILPYRMHTIQTSFSAVPGFAVPWNLGAIPFLLAATTGLVTAGCFVLLRRQKLAESFGLIIAGAVFFSLVLFEGLLPQVGTYLQGPLRTLAQSASREMEPTSPLIVFGLNNPSLLFYAKRPAIILSATDFPELRKYLTQPQRQTIITQAQLARKLPQDIPLYVVERQGGYVLFSNKPPEGKP